MFFNPSLLPFPIPTCIYLLTAPHNHYSSVTQGEKNLCHPTIVSLLKLTYLSSLKPNLKKDYILNLKLGTQFSAEQ